MILYRKGLLFESKYLLIKIFTVWNEKWSQRNQRKKHQKRVNEEKTLPNNKDNKNHAPIICAVNFEKHAKFSAFLTSSFGLVAQPLFAHLLGQQSGIVCERGNGFNASLSLLYQLVVGWTRNKPLPSEFLRLLNPPPKRMCRRPCKTLGFRAPEQTEKSAPKKLSSKRRDWNRAEPKMTMNKYVTHESELIQSFWLLNS